jgi:hypothetical protein
MNTVSGCIVAVINFLVVLLWLCGIVLAAKRSHWVRSPQRALPRVHHVFRRLCVPELVATPAGFGLEAILQGVRGPLPGCPRGLVFYSRVFVVSVPQLVVSLLAATVSNPCGVQTTVLTVVCIALALAILFLRPMAAPILNVLLAVGYLVLGALACTMVLESSKVVTALKFLLDAVVLVRMLISVIGRVLVRSTPPQTNEVTGLTETLNGSPEIELNSDVNPSSLSSVEKPRRKGIGEVRYDDRSPCFGTPFLGEQRIFLGSTAH